MNWNVTQINLSQDELSRLVIAYGRILALFVRADGQLQPEEKAILKSLIFRTGYTEDECEQLNFGHAPGDNQEKYLVVSQIENIILYELSRVFKSYWGHVNNNALKKVIFSEQKKILIESIQTIQEVIHTPKMPFGGERVDALLSVLYSYCHCISKAARVGIFGNRISSEEKELLEVFCNVLSKNHDEIENFILNNVIHGQMNRPSFSFPHGYE